MKRLETKKSKWIATILIWLFWVLIVEVLGLGDNTMTILGITVFVITYLIWKKEKIVLTDEEINKKRQQAIEKTASNKEKSAIRNENRAIARNEKIAQDKAFNSMRKKGIHPETGQLLCKKCGSSSLSANKKGFGIGKAVVGAAMTGGIGLIGGNIGARKVRITCMNCGKSWMAGKR